nr:ribonuclease H-like domain-containing protein [Tanacetum cinerariifolium]
EVLPYVRSDYAIISSEESHRVASGSIDGSSQRNQASAFVSNVPNRRSFQRIQSSNNAPRHNNVNTNRKNGGSGLNGYEYPLHLHPNDSTTLIVVSVKLKTTKNYQVWSCDLLLALAGKNKTGFIDGSCKRSNTDEVLKRQ